MSRASCAVPEPRAMVDALAGRRIGSVDSASLTGSTANLPMRLDSHSTSLRRSLDSESAASPSLAWRPLPRLASQRHCRVAGAGLASDPRPAGHHWHDGCQCHWHCLGSAWPTLHGQSPGRPRRRYRLAWGPGVLGNCSGPVPVRPSATAGSGNTGKWELELEFSGIQVFDF